MEQEAAVKEAIAEHYNSLTEDEQGKFDAMSDEDKELHNKEIAAKLKSKHEEGGSNDDKVPLAKMLEYKRQAKENAEKLAKYENEAKLKKEADMAKNGEYKELLEAKTTELESLVAENAELKDHLGVFTKGIDEKVDKFLNSITDDTDKEMIEAILSGKNASEKANLLPALQSKFGHPDNINNNNVKGSHKPPTSEVEIAELQTKIDSAVKDGKPMDVLKLQAQLRTLRAK